MKTTLLSAIGLYLSIVTVLFAGFADGQIRLLPGDSAASLAATNQDAPQISAGSKATLAVWADFRSNPYGSYDYESSRDIYGMRFDSAGNPLDALPLPIHTGRANQNHPKAVWNGTDWLVVFQSVDVGGTGYYQDSLQAVRVSSTGEVLDPKPIKLFGLVPSGPSYWSVASDGNNWVVVNQSTPTSEDIVAVRVSPDGRLLDPPNRTIVPGTYFMRSGLRLAYAGGVFLLAFSDAYTNGGYDSKAVRFNSALNLLDPGPIPFLPVGVAGLSSNGSGFYVVWHRQEPDFSVHVVGSRVNLTGTRLDGNGVNISGTRQPGANAGTSVAFDGTNWRVTWGDISSAYTARVNSAGGVLDVGGVSLPGIQPGPSDARAGSLQVIWTEYANGNYDVFAANVSSTNTAGPKRSLSIGAPQQTRPDAAVGTNGFMVAYKSTTAAASRVLAQPLDISGNPLTPEPVELENGAAMNGPGSPNVAWNGTVFLVSWGSTNGIVATRLLPDGTKLDPTPFLVIPGGFGPADVAALGDAFLVTGRKIGINAQYIFPVAARISGTGTVLDATPPVIGGSYLRTAPAVVALGGRWLVAWHQNATHDDSYCMSMGTFVEPTGTLTSPFQIHGPFSTAGGNGIFEVGLASNGSTALFVQSQELTSGVENDLLARTITADGTVGPAANLTPWVGNQYRPRAAWDGNNFVVVYQDQRNRLALNTLDQLDARSDLIAMRVNAGGTKIDPQGFVFSASKDSETDPAVTAASGKIFLAGSMMQFAPAFNNYRIAYEIVPGNRPVATINADPIAGDHPLSVSFDSGGGLGLVTYNWDFGDGLTSTSPNPTHTFGSAGEFLVKLTATDEFGRQTVQARMVEVKNPNLVPVAIATSNFYNGNAPLNVILSAAGSYDPDGVIGNIEWRFSDGSYTYGATAYHTFTTVGIQTVTLLCYDSRGGVGTTTISINVGGTNLPPVASAAASPTSGSAPLTVQFSSAGSTDPDGIIVEYQWTFGDAFGYISREPNPAYVYEFPGTYTATLTVWDNNNVSSSANVVINVAPNAGTVMRSTAIAVFLAPQGKKISATSDVTIKDLNGSLIAGAVVSATWRLPNGTLVNQSATSNSRGVAHFKTSGTRGTYLFTVTNVQKNLYTFDSAGSVLTASATR